MIIAIAIALIALVGVIMYSDSYRKHNQYTYITFPFRGDTRCLYLGRREAVAQSLRVDLDAILLQDNRIMFAADRARAMQRHPAGSALR